MNAAKMPVPVTAICTHIADIHSELVRLSVRVQPEFRPVYDDSVARLNQCLQAGRRYLQTDDSKTFNREIVLILMDFLLVWETWLKSGIKFQHKASYVFHSIMLRTAKGIIRRWRLWQIDMN
jgi:hypothetical protein